jgi:hypothetical protein
MRDLVDRGIAVAKLVVIGYLAVVIVGLAAIVFIGAAAFLANASSFDVSLGPVPLMSYWRDGASWGFSSGWGIGLLAPIGAVVGLVLGIRRGMLAERPVAE